jgi:ribosomal protein L14E/L6E/L27E
MDKRRTERTKHSKKTKEPKKKKAPKAVTDPATSMDTEKNQVKKTKMSWKDRKEARYLRHIRKWRPDMSQKKKEARKKQASTDTTEAEKPVEEPKKSKKKSKRAAAAALKRAAAKKTKMDKKLAEAKKWKEENKEKRLLKKESKKKTDSKLKEEEVPKKEKRKRKGLKTCRRKYVELGRIVVLINGKHRNTIAMIVDIVDHNWVLVEGRCFDQKEQGFAIKRKVVNVKDIALTHLHTKITYRANPRFLRKLIEKADLVKKWHQCDFFKKLEKRRHKKLSTDLERWRVQYNRRQRSYLIKVKYGKLKKKIMMRAKNMCVPKRPGTFQERLPKKKPLKPGQEPKPRRHKSKLTTGEKEGIKKLNLNFKAMWEGR